MHVEIPYEQFDWSRQKDKIGSPAWCFYDDEGEKIILIRCANCGCPSWLRTHTVFEDGTVQPSIWCRCNLAIPGVSGDWHVYGKLLEWTKHRGQN